MRKKYLTNRSKRSIKRNGRNKRRLTKRYIKSRRGGYNKSKKKMLGGMDTGTRGSWAPRGSRGSREPAGYNPRKPREHRLPDTGFKHVVVGVPPPGSQMDDPSRLRPLSEVSQVQQGPVESSGTETDSPISRFRSGVRQIIMEERVVDHFKFNGENWSKGHADGVDILNIEAWKTQMLETPGIEGKPMYSRDDTTDNILFNTLFDASRQNRIFEVNGSPDITHNCDSESVLFVIDMQNDFVGPEDFQPRLAEGLDMFGARFAVAEGPYINTHLANLIREWPGIVILSRDYHPHDHCSFMCSGKGNYPSHCVQGTRGSHFTIDIEEALFERFKDEGKRNKTYIVFKGCWESIDSYGAAKYNVPGSNWASIIDNERQFEPADTFFIKQPQNPEALGQMDDNDLDENTNVNHVPSRGNINSCSRINLTGSFYLQCSALTELEKAYIDALSKGADVSIIEQAFFEAIRSGPDVNAINEYGQNVDRSIAPKLTGTINKSIEEFISKDAEIYVVGLALDYCCTDTAVNLHNLEYTNVNLVVDLCRPPVIPLSIPGLSEEGDLFADETHSTTNTHLRWLTKRIASFRNPPSDVRCPVWWFETEIAPTNVNLIYTGGRTLVADQPVLYGKDGFTYCGTLFEDEVDKKVRVWFLNKYQVEPDTLINMIDTDQILPPSINLTDTETTDKVELEIDVSQLIPINDDIYNRVNPFS
jgi:nicotinamidase-related amidase